MRKILTIVLFILLTTTAEAKTITQGTLDIENIANRISGDLRDYSEKRQVLVENIKSVQKGIKKLKKDYDTAQGEKDRITIRARTLDETSRLLDYYSQFYTLNVKKVQSILPNLSKMRAAANNGVLGKASKQLANPRFKQNIRTLYSNLSALSVKFNNPNMKREVATLLKENELLYQQGKKGVHFFNNITKNIDKVDNYLRSIYARTLLHANILERKKVQTELAVELMQYALALKPIQQNMHQMNPVNIIDIPEIDYDEFVDPVINDAQYADESKPVLYQDPDINVTLKSYEDGPNFIK